MAVINTSTPRARTRGHRQASGPPRKPWAAIPALLLLATGCNNALLRSHAELIDTIRAGQSEILTRMPIDASSVHFSGSATNPGVRFSAGQEFYLEGRYVGLAGQFSGAAQGTGDRELTSDERAQFFAIIQDKSLTDEQRAARFYELLGRLLPPPPSGSVPIPVPPPGATPEEAEDSVPSFPGPEAVPSAPTGGPPPRASGPGTAIWQTDSGHWVTTVGGVLRFVATPADRREEWVVSSGAEW